MSRWYVTAIERLGAPDAVWPSIYGPTAGADPVIANSLHTLDLTPYLTPLTDFSQQMERDLTGGSFSSIKLDLADGDGALADLLGPFSATMAATNRYFGPWIQVVEKWGEADEALRFLGYLDETSLQWSEDDAKTQATVIHASQLLRERLITDFPSLLRPWPSVPTGVPTSFVQSTADALLNGVAPTFTPRSNATALEAALWATGQLSWCAACTKLKVIEYLGGHPRAKTYTYPLPTPFANSVTIGGNTYGIDHTEADPTITGTVVDGPLGGDHETSTYQVVRLILQGAPNLTGVLSLGATVNWATPESQRTHYLLDGSTIAAPTTGSDGPKFVKLNSVEQLVPGDILTLTFTDATSGVPRTVTADLPIIIDLDGETGRAYLATALSQGYANISKVRRNSQNPVLFDGLAYARALVAPFALSTAAFAPAPVDVPVLVWQPYDVATPSLYGVHNLQTVNQTGGLLVARRGPDNGAGSFPLAGIWSGAWGGTWAWLGLTSADATHRVYADVLQFPGGTNPYTAPVLYLEGDLSGGATIPCNGWRHGWRSWKGLASQKQDPESTWNGTAVVWTATTAVGDYPALLAAFAASTPTPGKYTRTSAGVWTFQAHTGHATLGSASTPSITGTPPTGNWLTLGMGLWASGDEQEALLALVVTGSTYPFTNVSACLLSQASGGNLTVRQSATLWATGAIPAGPWAVGGGLAVQTWTQTIDGLPYPHTVLHKLNGSTALTADLKTLEVIPQTLQPLLLTGTAGVKVIGGWYALALETYADANYVASRRLRFLHLDSNLVVVNGDPEADPSVPTDIGAYFRRGELVAGIVPDGALLAKLVRTSNTLNEMAGLVGGRLFTVGSTLPTTVERLKLGASVSQGNTLSVANSGDGMTVADYLEKFAAAQLASAVPQADGSMSLVSRSAGTLRTRTVAGQTVSVAPTERGRRTKTQAWQGYLRKVRVSYTDILTDTSASIEVVGSFDGGRILELDMSELVSGETMARALGQASAYWFGQPAPVLTEIWVDRTGGVSGDLAPTWWSTWSIGDRVILDPYTTPVPTVTWKLLKLQPGLEARTVTVELRQQPFLITPGA